MIPYNNIASFASGMAWALLIGALAGSVPACAQSASGLDTIIKQQRQATDQAVGSLQQTLGSTRNLGVQPASATVYLHAPSSYTDEQLVAIRRQIEKVQIGAANVIVPRIIRISEPPAHNQVRYFHSVEKGEAWLLKVALTQSIGHLVVQDDSSQNEHSTAIRARHYELWLKPSGVSAPGAAGDIDEGLWTVTPGGGCSAKLYHWKIGASVMSFTDESGQADLEHIVAVTPSGFQTETQSSQHITPQGAESPGTIWDYTFDERGRIGVQMVGTDRKFSLEKC